MLLTLAHLQGSGLGPPTSGPYHGENGEALNFSRVPWIASRCAADGRLAAGWPPTGTSCHANATEIKLKLVGTC